MPYFNELPNIRYGASSLGSSSNGDVVLVKNLFRRAKLRDDMVNAATAFQYYQIKDNERPDQIAKKAYDDANLDWVVLITNNITNINEQWPLDNESFYKYLLDKYGSDEEIQAIHHTETVEVKDEYDRLVVPKEIITDKDLIQDVVVGAGGGLDYPLSSFPVANGILPLKITITLGDYFQVWDRPSQDAGTYIAPEYFVTDIILKNLRKGIPEDRSTLNVYGRDETITDIKIPNSLNGFPSTWGGSTIIYGRDESETTVYTYGWVSDPINIAGDTRLYSIAGQPVEDTNTIIPIFRFKSIGVAPL
jgi:hypothetical protein